MFLLSECLKNLTIGALANDFIKFELVVNERLNNIGPDFFKPLVGESLIYYSTGALVYVRQAVEIGNRNDNGTLSSLC
jgi:hypothetical protein